jgi:hypothetical protein
MTPLQLEQLEILRDHVAADNMPAAAEAAGTLIRLGFRQAIPFDVAQLDKLILQDVDEQDSDCYIEPKQCAKCRGLS